MKQSFKDIKNRLIKKQHFFSFRVKQGYRKRQGLLLDHGKKKYLTNFQASDVPEPFLAKRDQTVKKMF